MDLVETSSHILVVMLLGLAQVTVTDVQRSVVVGLLLQLLEGPAEDMPDEKKSGLKK